MSFLIGSLVVLISLAGLSLLFGSGIGTAELSYEISNNAIINGSATSVTILDDSFLFSIDTTGLIVAIIILTAVVIGVAAVTGITVLATGLNPESAKIIVIVTSYIAVWTSLSILSYNLLIQIEIFGVLIYALLTIAYVVGVIRQLNGGDGS